MADETKCQVCEDLSNARLQALRSLHAYRPMHDGQRSKSKWLKRDREAVTGLERAYNRAEAEYQLHVAEHSDRANAHEVVKNIHIIMRNGRLKP